jgi:hypothetical protein
MSSVADNPFSVALTSDKEHIQIEEDVALLTLEQAITLVAHLLKNVRAAKVGQDLINALTAGSHDKKH